GSDTVGPILDSSRAGALQPGDRLITLNGQPIFRCIQFIGSPLYIPNAPPAVSVPVRFLRPATGLEGETQIVLAVPSGRDWFEGAVLFVTPAVFVIAGMIILIGGAPGWPQLLVGAAWCAVGLTFAGWVKIYESPLAILGWGGLAVSATLLIAAHAIWPVGQMDRPVVRGL